MPRIPAEYLHAVIYLYPNATAAEQGEPRGGTGFIVGVQRPPEPDWRFYVVTNSHVVKEAKSKVLRFNKKDSGVSTWDVSKYDWISHPNGDDVAAAPFPDFPDHERSFVPEEAFVDEAFLLQYGICPGMEAFMIGRLIKLDGQVRNHPSVRFGHLSMMVERAQHPRGIKQESFVLDMHSIGGYSGSPVFIYDNQTVLPGDNSSRFYGPRLLGINWGHRSTAQSVYAKTPQGIKKQTTSWKPTREWQLLYLRGKSARLSTNLNQDVNSSAASLLND